MLRIPGVLLSVLLCLLVLSTPALAADTVLQATSADGAAATLTLSADPLLSMTPTDVHLALDKAHGDLLLPTAAVCDLTMPAMTMPDNRPVLSCGAIGCRGQVVFTMAGAWDVTCDVTFASGQSERFVFVIDRVQMK